MVPSVDRLRAASVGGRLKREFVFLGVWIVVLALFGNEFVGESVAVSGFVTSVVLGGLAGIVVAYWLRRTTSGRSTGARYRDASFGRRVFAALVIVVVVGGAVLGALLFAGLSTVLGEAGFLGALLTHRLTDTALLYSRSQ